MRNRGTIGGNLAHADPASDWATVLTALGATVSAQGPSGARTIAVSDLIEDAFATVLAEDELITTISVPVLAANQRAEYAKMAHPASFYAVVGGAVVVTMDGNRCTAASVAVGGLTPRPVKAPSVEQALSGTTLTADSIGDATSRLGEDITAAGVDIIGDVYASAEFRAGVAARGGEARPDARHRLGPPLNPGRTPGYRIGRRRTYGGHFDVAGILIMVDVSAIDRLTLLDVEANF